MEIKVLHDDVQKRTSKPYYRVTIDFMEGDADGSQKDYLDIEVEGDWKERLTSVVVALAACSAAYPNGRGGYDEYNGLPEYDCFFCDEFDETSFERLYGDTDFAKEGFEAMMKRVNPFEYYFDHPSDSNYISTSFDGFYVEYFNENGDMHDVEIEFSKEEQKRINKAAVILK